MNCAYRFTSTYLEKYKSDSFNYEFVYKIDSIGSQRENYCVFIQDLFSKKSDQQDTVDSQNIDHNDFIAGIIYSKSFSFASQILKDYIIENIKSNIYTQIGQPEESFANLNSLLSQKYYSLESYADESLNQYPFNELNTEFIDKQTKMVNLIMCIKKNIYVSQPIKGQQNIWIVKLKNSNEYQQIQQTDLIQISDQCYKVDINYDDIQEIILSDQNNEFSELTQKRIKQVEQKMEWFYSKQISKLYYLKLKK
ncbi:hypothetical protein ABPG74_010571 [Tetrahymena malaccensis]